MSGEKVARVDLNAVARNELNRILTASRENARALANLTNLLGKLQNLLEDVNRCLGSPEISEGLRQKLEAFQALVTAFIALHRQLRAKLDQIEQLRDNPDPQSARDQANRLQGEIQRMTQELSQLAAKINEKMPEIEASLAAEEHSEEHRARMADQRRRGELAGLLEELKIRLHPATSLNLQSVSERAGSLLASIEKLISQPSGIPEAEVRKLRQELDELTREVEQREGEVEEQWAIFSRLNDAFQGAGFQLNTPAHKPQYGVPIQATHTIDEDELRASIISQVYKGGTVNLEMFGASGDESAALGRDQHCDVNLNRIISKALACGLVVKSVAWKDPKDPDNLLEMDIPGVEFNEQPQPTPRKKEEHTMQIK